MSFQLQPTTLRNEPVTLCPLTEADFDILFKVASDPVIWLQHPARDRYKIEVFRHFFDGAIASGGAFIIKDTQTSVVIGSTRYYQCDLENDSIYIGYTFFAHSYWGSTYNHSAKKLMLDHAFRFVSRVFFEIGAENIRSQTSIKKLGAEKIAEHFPPNEPADPTSLHYVFEIRRENWQNL